MSSAQELDYFFLRPVPQEWRWGTSQTRNLALTYPLMHHSSAACSIARLVNLVEQAPNEVSDFLGEFDHVMSHKNAFH